MTEQQLERWNQLSIGLARSYKNLTPARSAKLLAEVEACIDWAVCNGLETVGDWDNGVCFGPGWHEHHDSVSTRVDDYLWDHRFEFERGTEVVRGRFGDMLSACVRAGFDVAVSPSAGVIGFTVGDLRSTFSDGLPDWVTNYFQDPLSLAKAGSNEPLWL